MRFIIICLALIFPLSTQAGGDKFKYFISKNPSNILTQNSSIDNSWDDIEVGFIASFQIKNLKSNKVTQTIEYHLERIDGEKYYFDVDWISSIHVRLCISEVGIFSASAETHW